MASIDEPAIAQSRPIDDCEHTLQILWGHLLNSLGEFAFFVQDAQGRYEFASQSFITILNQSPHNVLGHVDAQIFSSSSAEELESTHNWVVVHGRSLMDELVPLEMTRGRTRWFLMNKIPVFDHDGTITSIVGYYRLLAPTNDTERQLPNIAAALRHFRNNVSGQHTLASLAGLAQISPYQFERRVKRVFGVSTRDYMIKARMQLGRDLLKKSNLEIVAIARECGYSDQSSFTRQFRISTGLPPGEFRRLEREGSRAMGYGDRPCFPSFGNQA